MKSYTEFTEAVAELKESGSHAAFIKTYKKNEANNQHSENVVLLAHHVGSDEDKKEAASILSAHNKAGHLPQDVRTRRDALHKKLWSPSIKSSYTTESVEEAFVHPNHKELDANNNGKVDAHDFKLLRLIKQAIGIANDKRYKGGDMTGAVKAIEKLQRGLSNHPKVKAALRLANESVELAEGGWPLPGQPMKTTATITKNKDGSTTTSFPDGTWKIESKNYVAKKKPTNLIYTHAKSDVAYQNLVHQLHKEEVELDEAKKEPMEVYHSGYSAALQHAEKHLNKQGYEIHPDDWQHHISHGPAKPSEGKTVKLHIPLQRNGEKCKKVAHIQVYNRGDKIPKNNELNMYVS